MRKRFLILCSVALWTSACLSAPALQIRVDAGKPGARINPAMWGIFFEDINFAADGGLYAELVKNRGFEFPDSWMGWSKIIPTNAVGSVEIRDEDPCDTANPHYVRIRTGFFSSAFGIANEGFRGMGIREHAKYRFSVQARAIAGKPVLRVELRNNNGSRIAGANLSGFSFKWEPYSTEFRADAADLGAQLALIVEGPGILELDMISLFPVDTWKHRVNGLRADVVQLLADLKPGFMRFPGGCIVEGRDLNNRYRWKNTIGDPADRHLIINRWNTEFKNRATPDYFQSFGLGFFEYFQLCEDIGAEPLPIINCGMACQFNSGQLASLEELGSYIQDALDLVEFANGSAQSEWGAKRAAMGHPAPFGLKLLGVGNEQWGPQYVERYARFAKTLKSKYPDVQLVGASGPDPDGQRFDYLWTQHRRMKTDLVDEHFYRSPQWFLDHTHRYDRYDRAGPKVFAGEYAAHVADRGNTLESALAEAAMMTGFERNADVVRMASYAPLLAHEDAWQWRPNLIWFDNLRVVATPDYYAQQLFSRNRGDVVLSVRLNAEDGAAEPLRTVFASATRDDKAGEIILKIVNAGTNAISAGVHLDGIARRQRVSGTETVLTAESLKAENSFELPRRVTPRLASARWDVPDFDHTFPPCSLTVLRVAAKQ